MVNKLTQAKQLTEVAHCAPQNVTLVSTRTAGLVQLLNQSNNPTRYHNINSENILATNQHILAYLFHMNVYSCNMPKPEACFG